MARVGIGGALRTAKRVRRILTVLIRFGFADLVSDLGLYEAFHHGRQFFGLTKKEGVEKLTEAERVRHAIEELGPTFIKFGQVLSTRPDLIPPEWAVEFKKLQTRLEPSAWEDVKPMLEREFPQGLDRVFDSVEEEAFAAASIAQVHRARLKGGKAVCLKILRPNIREVIRSDMDILRRLAGLGERHFSRFGYSALEVVRQFSRALERETDLTWEGYAADRMADDFADHPNVTFPKIYWEASTKNVLCMEEMRGTLLADYAAESRSVEERTQIVKTGSDVVFRQCLEIGFFHADPHPGNVFVLPGGRLAFIDCGMTGHIDPDTAAALADLILATTDADLDRVVQIAIDLSGADSAKAFERQFRVDAWAFIDRFQVGSLRDLRVGELLESFFDLVRTHELKCPADLVYLIKAIAMIEGVGEQIAPEFDVVSYAQPYVERLIRKRYGPAAVGRRVMRGVLGYLKLVEEFPANLRQLFRSLREKQMSLVLEHRGLDRLTHVIERSAVNLSSAVLVGALIIGSSLLILADQQGEGQTWLKVVAIIGYTCAGLVTFLRILTSSIRR